MQLYEIIGLTWKGVRMILIDYKDRRPIYEQVVEKMADLMVRGILPQDSQLPSAQESGHGAGYKSQYHTESLR